MNRLGRAGWLLVVCGPLVAVPAWVRAQQTAAPPANAESPQQGEVVQTPGQQTPELAHRPGAEPPLIGMNEEGRGSLQLNVVVTDKSGTPVSGLKEQDFAVLDNGQPRRIESFQAYNGAVHAGGPPVETLILLDTLNMNALEAGQARVGIDKYLRGNGGHLAGPTSVFIFSEDGVQGEQPPTTDGNALAAKVDQMASRNRSMGRAAGEWGDLERFNLSLKALGLIVQNEAKRPGRKLVIWVGPGWPLMYGNNQRASQKDMQQEFSAITNINKILREDQITLYSVSIGEPDTYSSLYNGFLKGVKSAKDAMPADLNTKVLATQSGGLVVGPDNDLARQIETCQQDTSAYYTITIAPERPDKRDEYHQIEVQTDKPYLKVRTSTGYYDEP